MGGGCVLVDGIGADVTWDMFLGGWKVYALFANRVDLKGCMVGRVTW